MKSSIYKYFLFTFVVLLTFGTLSSQNDPALRIEINVKSDDAKYRVIPCGETGAALCYKTTVSEENYKFWIYVFYNKLFQETWKKNIPVYENMNYADHEIDENYLYCFFHDPEKRKSERYNFQVLKIDMNTGIYELFSGIVPESTSFVDFKVSGNMVIIGLNTDKNFTGIYGFNMSTKETKSFFEITDKKARFDSFSVDDSRSSFLSVFNVHESKGNYYLLLKEFDFNGNERNSLQIFPEQGKKFNTGKITTLSGNTKLVFGTYVIVKNINIDAKDYFKKESSGFYTVNVTDPNNLVISYQSFLDLENMTGYLRGREYQLAKKKAEKKEENKDKYAVTYDLLLHDIIERDSLFYFVGEAFYEQYRTVSNTYYDYYGRAIPVSHSVFDGYQYFNAFVSCYDHEGTKLWDNGMEIFNILTFDLKKRINVLFSGDEMVLAYNRQGKISAKIIDGPETIEGVESYPLDAMYGNDKIMTDSKSNMVHWYKNYFLAYGFQTIRNNSLVDNNKRIVFYINKVMFE